MASNNARPQQTSNNQQPIYANIIGWGMYVPEEILTNQDLEAILDTSDEWIQSRTGIQERHIVGEKESTFTLGLKAARQALEVTDVVPSDIDLIIVATCTPDNMFPSTASLIQDALRAKNAGAFDLSAACSGFVYGVQMATQAIRSGSINTAVVIGAETMSRVMNWQDRTTSILFGDGAGAVVLQRSHEKGGVLSAILRSDGAGADLLGIPSLPSPIYQDGEHKNLKMFMVGGEVFKFATRVIVESIHQAVEKAGITIEDVALIVPHQANDRILASAARALGVDKDLFMTNLVKYGNTSAASIPIALSEAVQLGRVKEGEYIVFVGFGGGLTWASMVIQWRVPKPQEHQGSKIAAQRRRFAYFRVNLRVTWRKWKRRISATINRVRPNYGRTLRLRQKIDQYEIDE